MTASGERRCARCGAPKSEHTPDPDTSACIEFVPKERRVHQAPHPPGGYPDGGVRVTPDVSLAVFVADRRAQEQEKASVEEEHETKPPRGPSTTRSAGAAPAPQGAREGPLGVSELSMFELDDGESYWIVARSAEDALNIGRKRYEIPAEEGEEVVVTACDPDALKTIGWGDDGWDPLPEGAVVEGGDRQLKRVTATVRAWVAIHSEGDLVCATIW